MVDNYARVVHAFHALRRSSNAIGSRNRIASDQHRRFSAE